MAEWAVTHRGGHQTIETLSFFFFFFFIFGCVGSSVRARAFSSYGKWGPLFIAVQGPLFIAVRGPFTIAAPPFAGHRLQTRRLSSCGSRAQLVRGMWVGSSQTRARTRVPCISRQILNHCATREAPETLSFYAPQW